MDDFKQRHKKSDKAKEKYERNGKNTTKYVRLMEKLSEKKKAI
uniref:Uncharacterized protein n=1 Tax=viral metagenome TaxID=1070528 RepID=A0A6C0D6P9_9ZZZZ